ncbi:hypothetical protein QYE76_000894 [Lolium multiflorum]|uniref:Gnk2-homologous domain-containing protein n=1 Tax=Lolium multiflorum TaxID=4521 RepID=A0AAD8RK53_LOLMU|nr:hypothetical protein QYE76_000894 [Lolium multiflorum]
MSWVIGSLTESPVSNTVHLLAMAPTSCFRLLLLLVVFGVYYACAICVVVDASKTLQPSVVSCSTAGNYSDGSQYHKKLYNLLLAIPMAATQNGGFFNGTVGTEVDEVFGLVMCYDDNTDTECLDCLTRALEGIMKLCPHSRTVRAVYDACTLRYSNESFFSVADLAIEYHHVQQIPPYRGDGVTVAAYVVDTAGMSRTRFELFPRLTERAGLAVGRVAGDIQHFTDAQQMGAVAQCTRDLPASDCTRCLSNFTHQLPRLLPTNSSGAIRGYSFYLAYAIFTEKPLAGQLDRNPYRQTYKTSSVQAAEESERSKERQERRHR